MNAFNRFCKVIFTVIFITMQVAPGGSAFSFSNEKYMNSIDGFNTRQASMFGPHDATYHHYYILPALSSQSAENLNHAINNINIKNAATRDPQQIEADLQHVKMGRENTSTVQGVVIVTGEATQEEKPQEDDINRSYLPPEKKPEENTETSEVITYGKDTETNSVTFDFPVGWEGGLPPTYTTGGSREAKWHITVSEKDNRFEARAGEVYKGYAWMELPVEVPTGRTAIFSALGEVAAGKDKSLTLTISDTAGKEVYKKTITSIQNNGIWEKAAANFECELKGGEIYKVLFNYENQKGEDNDYPGTAIVNEVKVFLKTDEAVNDDFNPAIPFTPLYGNWELAFGGGKATYTHQGDGHGLTIMDDLTLYRGTIQATFAGEGAGVYFALDDNYDGYVVHFEKDANTDEVLLSISKAKNGYIDEDSGVLASYNIGKLNLNLPHDINIKVKTNQIEASVDEGEAVIFTTGAGEGRIGLGAEGLVWFDDVTVYENERKGRVEKNIKPDGTVTTYEYDKEGRVIGMEKSDGSKVTYNYTETENGTRVTDQKSIPISPAIRIKKETVTGRYGSTYITINTTLWLNDELIQITEDVSASGKDSFIIVLDGVTGEIVDKRGLTFYYGDSTETVNYLNSIKEGDILMLGTLGGSYGSYISPELETALLALGSTKAKDIATSYYNNRFALMAKKGEPASCEDALIVDTGETVQSEDITIGGDKSIILQQTVTTEYDNEGRISEITDEKGKKTTYDYDTNSETITVTYKVETTLEVSARAGYNWSKFYVNKKEINLNTGSTGITVTSIDNKTGEVIETRRFTSYSGVYSSDLANYIDSINDGTYLMIAFELCAFYMMPSSTYDIIRSLGGSLEGVSDYDTYFLVVKKGDLASAHDAKGSYMGVDLGLVEYTLTQEEKAIYDREGVLLRTIDAEGRESVFTYEENEKGEKTVIETKKAEAILSASAGTMKFSVNGKEITFTNDETYDKNVFIVVVDGVTNEIVSKKGFSVNWQRNQSSDIAQYLKKVDHNDYILMSGTSSSWNGIYSMAYCEELCKVMESLGSKEIRNLSYSYNYWSMVYDNFVFVAKKGDPSNAKEVRGAGLIEIPETEFLTEEKNETKYDKEGRQKSAKGPKGEITHSYSYTQEGDILTVTDTTKIPIELSIISRNYDARFFIDGQEVNLGYEAYEASYGFIVGIADDVTGNVIESRTFNGYGVSDMDNMADYINSIENGKYVMIASGFSGIMSSAISNENLHSVLESLGCKKIGESGNYYAFLAIKGDPTTACEALENEKAEVSSSVFTRQEKTVTDMLVPPKQNLKFTYSPGWQGKLPSTYKTGGTGGVEWCTYTYAGDGVFEALAGKVYDDGYTWMELPIEVPEGRTATFSCTGEICEGKGKSLIIAIYDNNQEVYTKTIATVYNGTYWDAVSSSFEYELSGGGTYKVVFTYKNTQPEDPAYIETAVVDKVNLTLSGNYAMDDKFNPQVPFTPLNGEWDITNGAYQQLSTSGKTDYLFISKRNDVIFDKGTVEATFNMNDISSDGGIILCFGMDENGNGYGLYFKNDQGLEHWMAFVKLVNGEIDWTGDNWTDRKYSFDEPLDIGLPHTLKVEVGDDTIKGYLDDVLYIETDKVAYTKNEPTGLVGIGATGPASFDEVAITRGRDIVYTADEPRDNGRRKNPEEYVYYKGKTLDSLISDFDKREKNRSGHNVSPTSTHEGWANNRFKKDSLPRAKSDSSKTAKGQNILEMSFYDMYAAYYIPKGYEELMDELRKDLAQYLDLRTLVKTLNENEDLENMIKTLEEKGEDRSELDEKILEAARLIEEKMELLSDDTVKELEKVVMPRLMIVEVTEYQFGEKDLKEIKKSLDNLSEGIRGIDEEYSLLTDNLYDRLAEIFGIEVEEKDITDDSRKPVNITLVRNIKINAAGEELVKKDIRALTPAEKEARAILLKLQVINGKYREKLERVATQFIEAIKNTVKNISHISLVIDEDKINVLFTLQPPTN